MSAREVELSTLVGRKVRDADGRVVGRIEELCAEVALDEGSEYVVREFHVGHYGVVGRVAAGRFSRYVARLVRPGRYVGYVVPWELMDLSDPRRPRIRARLAALRAVERP